MREQPQLRVRAIQDLGAKAQAELFARNIPAHRSKRLYELERVSEHEWTETPTYGGV